jgi:hypothetical protein
MADPATEAATPCFFVRAQARELDGIEATDLLGQVLHDDLVEASACDSALLVDLALEITIGGGDEPSVDARPARVLHLIVERVPEALESPLSLASSGADESRITLVDDGQTRVVRVRVAERNARRPKSAPSARSREGA